MHSRPPLAKSASADASASNRMSRRRTGRGNAVATTTPRARTDRREVVATSFAEHGPFLETDYLLDLEMGAEQDEQPAIDYSSVGLYIVAIQVVVAAFACSAVVVACTWLLPQSGNAALRALALSQIVGILIVRWPLSIARARGMNVVFQALRPAVGLYGAALASSQLARCCPASTGHSALLQKTTIATVGDESTELFRARIGRAAIASILIMSAAARAYRPRAETDVSFLMASVALCLAAFMPVWSIDDAGPLCHTADGFEACERMARASLFASVYATHVYAAAPSQNDAREITICVARAAAASLWCLFVVYWLLPLAPLQILVVLVRSMRDSRARRERERGLGRGPERGAQSFSHEGSERISQMHFEQLPLTTRADGSLEELELDSGGFESSQIPPKADDDYSIDGFGEHGNARVANTNEMKTFQRGAFKLLLQTPTTQSNGNSRDARDRPLPSAHSDMTIQQIIARESALAEGALS